MHAVRIYLVAKLTVQRWLIDENYGDFGTESVVGNGSGIVGFDKDIGGARGG